MDDSSRWTMDIDSLSPMLTTVRASHTTPGPHPSNISLDCLGLLLTDTYPLTDGDIVATNSSTEAISMYLAAPHKQQLTTTQLYCSSHIHHALATGESGI
jgi:hypothetical protein